MDLRDELSATDYVIDETYQREGENQLLNDKGDGPNLNLTNRREAALAALAAAIHVNARHLGPEQIEQAIGWLKTWKLQHVPLSRPDGNSGQGFYEVLEKLKTNAEQTDLQKRARKHIHLAYLTGLGLALSAAVTLAMFFIGSVAWYFWVVATVVNWYFYIKTDMSILAAALLYKEQDRKYGFASIRQAETVVELLEAGIFAYIPGTAYEVGQEFNDTQARRWMKAERDRLTDALYRDPNGYLSARALAN